MLEVLLCSLVTLLPDYLYRRYVQGKRFGKEITLFSVWYELRFGIITCLMLTITLITVVFYYHPATTNVNILYRTVTILPEAPGRVAEIFVKSYDKVEAGAPLFRLDSSAQEAALETARRKSTEVDASIEVAKTELATADGTIQQAQGAYQQAVDALDTKLELQARNASTVAERDVERLRNAVDGAKGALAAATAAKETQKERISSLLPAQKASAEAAIQQAEVDLGKTTVRAGVAGTVTQFTLRVGDVITTIRPAGILIPTDAGRTVVAGFGQIEAPIMKVGMIGEILCSSNPFTIVPVVVTQIQNVIAAGQNRPTDQLIELQDVGQAGTITVFFEALYPGQLDDIPRGSSCTANAYTSNADRLANDKDLSPLTGFALHAVDALGLVHAILIRIQAVVTPVQTLVLTGGH